jgi:Tfp pilus assembly protein PilO
MGKMKQSWLLTAVLILAVLGAGYFFGAKPQAAKAKQVRAQSAAEKSANATLQQDITRLQKQSAGVVAKLARRREIAINVPDNPALPRLIRGLSTIRDKSGVSLKTIQPGPPVLDSAPVIATPVPAAKTAATSGATASASAAPAAAKAAPAAAPAAAGSLAAVPVAMTISGDFSQLELFLTGLEKLDRSFVVNAITVTPAGDAATTDGAAAAKPKTSKTVNTLDVTITGRVFMKVAPTAPPVVKAAKPKTEE